MTWPSSARASRSIASPPTAGSLYVVLTVPMSPRPREREDEQEDHDEPAQRHPHCGVESHEVGAAARPRSELMPAPSAVVNGFDLVLRVRHDASCSGKAVRDDAGGRAGRRQRRRGGRIGPGGGAGGGGG